MKWNDFKVSTKLYIGFFLIITLSAIIGFVSYNAIKRIQDRTSKVEEISKTLTDLNKVRLSLRTYIDFHRETDYEMGIDLLNKMIENTTKLKERFIYAENREYAKVVIENLNNYKSGSEIIRSSINQKEAALQEIENTAKDIETIISNRYNNQSNEGFQNLILSRLFINQFIRKNEQSYIDRFNEAFSKAENVINSKYPGIFNKLLIDYKTSLTKLISATDASLENEKKLISYGENATLNINKAIASLKNQQESIISLSVFLVIFFVAISIVVGTLISMFIAKSISNSISTTCEILEKISMGDLRVFINEQLKNKKDEFGFLARVVDKMISELKKVATNISNGIVYIAAASEQLSSTSQELSQGASEQASSTEEISSSMEEMASNIEQNSENAQNAEKIAQKTDDGMNQVAASASKSLDSVKEITQKISIISEIAFQTNILALNAAVEAARAGEHGRGFAVVAAEVRKLAERSRIAATEIETLSKTSLNVTEESSYLMTNLTPEIQKTTQLAREIAASSLEQMNGAGQINSAIQQLNQVVQANAAASEEMATSSEELASQSEQLKLTINFFKLEEQLLENLKPNDSRQKNNKQAKFKETYLSKKTSSGIAFNMDSHHKDDDFTKF